MADTEMTATPTQQPDALRLADVLEKMPGYDWNKTYCEAAFQLRHIQRQNECLTAENEALRARLEAPNPADEFVFWTDKSWIDDAKRGRNGTFVNKSFSGFDVPLYTRPQCSKPLTDAEKHAMWGMATIDQCSHEQCYLRGIADSEAAHKII